MSALRHIVVTTLVSTCALAPLAATGGDARAAPSATSAVTVTSATSAVTISGRGFGHGVGLAQDGDLELGRQGKKMPQILGYFYPGTRFGSVSDVTIRAAVVEVDGHKPIDVTLPAGGVVRVGSSGVSVAKGGVARLTHDAGGYHAKLLNPPKHARPDTTSASGGSAYSVYSGGLEEVGGRSYHGVLTVAADGPKLRAINALPIETYLAGLGEVRDPSWPAASLQALVVAARSYALHSMHPGALFDVWSDDRSQVYLGAGGEYDALTSAVAKTRGLILTYDGSVADTVYSASGGGVTATAAEGFGDASGTAADEPYLTAGKYPTANPLPWSVTYSLATVAAALSYPGTLSGLSVTSVGPSGRATGVTLTGSRGPLVVPGLTLYHDLRLQSTLYTVGGVAATDAPTATVPAAVTVQTGTAGAAITPDASGAAAPHVVITSAAPLPTPSPVVAAPTTTPAGGIAAGGSAGSPASTDVPDAPTAAVGGAAITDVPVVRAGVATPGPASSRVMQPAMRLGSSTSPGAPTTAEGLAVGVWALALLGFAAGLTGRRRGRRRLSTQALGAQT